MGNWPTKKPMDGEMGLLVIEWPRRTGRLQPDGGPDPTVDDIAAWFETEPVEKRREMWARLGREFGAPPPLTLPEIFDEPIAKHSDKDGDSCWVYRFRESPPDRALLQFRAAHGEIYLDTVIATIRDAGLWPAEAPPLPSQTEWPLAPGSRWEGPSIVDQYGASTCLTSDGGTGVVQCLDRRGYSTAPFTVNVLALAAKAGLLPVDATAVRDLIAALRAAPEEERTRVFRAFVGEQYPILIKAEVQRAERAEQDRDEARRERNAAETELKTARLNIQLLDRIIDLVGKDPVGGIQDLEERAEKAEQERDELRAANTRLEASWNKERENLDDAEVELSNVKAELSLAQKESACALAQLKSASRIIQAERAANAALRTELQAANDATRAAVHDRDRVEKERDDARFSLNANTINVDAIQLHTRDCIAAAESERDQLRAVLASAQKQEASRQLVADEVYGRGSPCTADRVLDALYIAKELRAANDKLRAELAQVQKDKADPSPQWVLTKDCLPETGKAVLVDRGYGVPEWAWRPVADDPHFTNGGESKFIALSWIDMKIPNPPSTSR